MLVLLALYVPTQFPVGATTGWAGELLQRFNPLTAGLHFLGRLVMDGHGAFEEASWPPPPFSSSSQPGSRRRSRPAGLGSRGSANDDPLRDRRRPGRGARRRGGARGDSRHRAARHLARPRLGRHPARDAFAFSSTLSAGGSATGLLVAHLNVVSLDPATYVDPEAGRPTAPGTSTRLRPADRHRSGGR